MAVSDAAWDVGRDKLAFDSQGNLVGTAATVPFSLGAVSVNEVRLTGSTLEIEGTGRHSHLRDGSLTPFLQERQRYPYNDCPGRQYPNAVNDALARVFSIGLMRISPSMRRNLGSPGFVPIYISRGRKRNIGMNGRDPALPSRWRHHESTPGLTAPDPQYPVRLATRTCQGVVIIGLVVALPAQPQRSYREANWGTAWMRMRVQNGEAI